MNTLTPTTSVPRGWSQVKTNNSVSKDNINNLIEILPLTNDQWADKQVFFRPIGPLSSYAVHWMKLRKRDGGYYNQARFCLNYDQENGEFKEHGCPYCKGSLKPQRKFLQNVIVRALQQQEPKNVPQILQSEATIIDYYGYQCRFKNKDSQSWTPVRVLQVPSTVAEDLRQRESLNPNKIKDEATGETYPAPFAHPEFGFDLLIQYNSKGNVQSKYYVDRVESTKLTQDEVNYLIYDLRLVKAQSLAEAQSDYNTLASKIIHEDATGDGSGGGTENVQQQVKQVPVQSVSVQHHVVQPTPIPVQQTVQSVPVQQVATQQKTTHAVNVNQDLEKNFDDFNDI